MNNPVTRDARRKTVCALMFVTGAILGTSMSPAVAQSIASYTDKTISRLCTNQCVQGAEEVVVNSAGDAISVWSEPTGTPSSNLVMSRFSASAGTWSGPRVIFRDDFIGDISTGIDGSGNVIMVWEHTVRDADGNYYNRISASRYIAAEGSWTAPVAIGGGLISDLVSLTVGKNGDAIMLSSGRQNETSVMRFDAATSTWRLQDVPSNIHSKFAFDSGGNAFSAYNYANPFDDNKFVSTYRFDYATKTWRASATLDSYIPNNDPNAVEPRDPRREFSALSLSMDPYGSAMVMWQVSTVESVNNGVIVWNRTIKSSRFIKSRNAWVAKSVARINKNAINGPALVADKNANVSAIWTQYVGSYAKPVTARYSSSTGQWSSPKVISAGSYNTRDARIAASPSGSLFATWSQRTDAGTGSGTGKIFRATSARYSGSVGAWGAPKIIQDANRNSYLPQMSIDSKGRAIVIWQQDSGAVRSDGSPIKQLKSDRLIPY